jgi:hypothetical protein
MFQWLGKTLIFIGLLTTLLGILFYFSEQIPFLKYFGRLPGDISIRRENFGFYFPLTTSVIISVILTLLFYLIGMWKR